MKIRPYLVGTSLLFLLSAQACSGLSQKEASALEDFQTNAELYFRGQDYARCMHQVQKGLAIDPNHYRLNQLKGQVFLAEAQSDPAAFDKALRQFEKVKSLRWLSSHDYRTYLFLGQSHLGIALRHRRDAVEAERKAAGSETAKNDRERLLAEAKEHRRLLSFHLSQAELQFRTMMEIGDGLLAAKQYLFIVESSKVEELEGTARNEQLQSAAKAGTVYLAEIEQRLAHYNRLSRSLTDVAAEAEAQNRRRLYERREKDCRSQLAAIYYTLEKYEDALKEHERIAKLDPTNAANYYNRALCHRKLGHKDQARKDLMDFLRFTRLPRSAQQSQRALAMLEELGRS